MDQRNFINNMKNYNILRKLLTETLPPREALNLALIDEKGNFNHLQLTNKFKSNGSSLHKPHSHFNAKREPTLNIEKSNNCMKCGGTFSKGHIAVCSANDTTCFSCKYKGHFTRLCRPRRKNVNIVNSQIVDITDFNPSDFPDVNTDHVEWSEFGQYKRMVRIWTKPKRRLSCIKCNYDFWRRRKRVEEVIEYWPRKIKSSNSKYTSGFN